MQIRIFGAFKHLFLLLVKLLPVIIFGLRNNWYQSYNFTIIEIGAQRSQSGPIAWPNLCKPLSPIQRSLRPRKGPLKKILFSFTCINSDLTKSLSIFLISILLFSGRKDVCYHRSWTLDPEDLHQCFWTDFYTVIIQ